MPMGTTRKELRIQIAQIENLLHNQEKRVKKYQNHLDSLIPHRLGYLVLIIPAALVLWYQRRPKNPDKKRSFFKQQIINAGTAALVTYVKKQVFGFLGKK